MYRGAEERERGAIPATVYSVRKLTQPEQYHGGKHCLTTDNWYASFELIDEVAKEPIKMHVVGTNRKGLHKAGLFPAKRRLKRNRGVYE